MAVNDELAVLRRAIPASIEVIGVGGRVVVESYHSLEDRLVKRAFADATRLDVPPDLPFVPEGAEPALRLVTRGAEQADEHEIAENPRAASVRLRAVERVLPSLVLSPFPRSRLMSSPALQPRTRVTRIAQEAVDKARLTVVPRVRYPRAAGAVHDAGQPGPGRRHRGPAPLQHLHAAGVVHGVGPRDRGRHPRRARADAPDGARRAPQPAARGDRGADDGHGDPVGSGVPRPRDREDHRRPDARHPGERHPAAAAGADQAGDPRARADVRRGARRTRPSRSRPRRTAGAANAKPRKNRNR